MIQNILYIELTPVVRNIFNISELELRIFNEILRHICEQKPPPIKLNDKDQRVNFVTIFVRVLIQTITHFYFDHLNSPKTLSMSISKTDQLTRSRQDIWIQSDFKRFFDL